MINKNKISKALYQSEWQSYRTHRQQYKPRKRGFPDQFSILLPESETGWSTPLTTKKLIRTTACYKGGFSLCSNIRNLSHKKDTIYIHKKENKPSKATFAQPSFSTNSEVSITLTFLPNNKFKQNCNIPNQSRKCRPHF